MREKMKSEVAQLQQSAVHNHTAAMLEMGTNLLSQTAEQTRKLTDVEAQVSPYWMQKLSADLYKRVIIYIYFPPWQVLNQTSRLEIQLLENSLSTNKLEKQLMIQTNEISKLHDKNR